MLIILILNVDGEKKNEKNSEERSNGDETIDGDYEENDYDNNNVRDEDGSEDDRW